jgi:adenosylhomocysteine nucleosidase
MKTLLLVAAEAREFDGLVRRLENVKKLEWPLPFARLGEGHGNWWTMVANGPGPRLAARAADTVREKEKELDAVISIGFCGALDPGLAIGDVVVGERVLDPDGRRQFAARLPENCRPHATGAVVSIDRVATAVFEKSELRASGGTVVEMEAAGVAERAGKWGVPFYCVRAVSDTAAYGFNIDFNAMRGADGRFQRGRIIRAALRKPFTRIPALLRLDKSCQIAAEALGEFLAGCRF